MHTLNVAKRHARLSAGLCGIGSGARAGRSLGQTARARVGSAGQSNISRRTDGVRAVTITRRAKTPAARAPWRRACSRSTRHHHRPLPHSLRRLRPVCGCVRESARIWARARYAHTRTHKADCTHTRACARVCVFVCVCWCPRACTNIHMCVCLCACVCVMYVSIHACIYGCMWIYDVCGYMHVHACMHA